GAIAPAAVQSEAVGVHSRLVVHAGDIGLLQTVGQTDGQVVTGSIHPEGNAASGDVKTVHPGTGVLGGVAAQTLDPYAHLLRLITRGQAAYRAGTAHGDRVDQALARDCGALGATAELGGQLVDQPATLTRIGVFLHGGDKAHSHRITISNGATVEDQVGEFAGGCRPGPRGAAALEKLLDIAAALASYGHTDLIVLQIDF